MISGRRRRNQGGQELIEFALVALLLIVLLMGSFVAGMNLIRSIEANQTCRDLTDMYIHGADFSTFSMQQLAQRLAGGLSLQIGGGFAGNNDANTGNAGNTLITVSRIMYVGSTTSPNCAAVGASNCTNQNSFVFLQQLQFGNGTLNTTKPSTLGNPNTALISTSGVITNPITDAGAKLPSPGQGNMQSLWQSNANGQAPLQDGQVAYVVELFSQSPDLSLGSFSSTGVYSRYFF